MSEWGEQVLEREGEYMGREGVSEWGERVGEMG